MTGSGLPLREELRTRTARVTPLLQSPNRQTRYQQKYQVGITERAAHRIVVELADAGYITRERNGRRNHYTINAHFPLPRSDRPRTERRRAAGDPHRPARDQLAGRSPADERMIAGLLMAIGCALAGSVGMLLKQRGAVAAPTVLARHPLRSAVNLFGSKWWTIGWLVALGAWLLHVGALSLASLSIVQAVISAGLVFLAILAERFFGFQLGRRQWAGLLVTAVGLAVLALTQAPTTHDHASAPALIAVESSVIAISGALLRIDPPRAPASAQGHVPGQATAGGRCSAHPASRSSTSCTPR